MGTRRKLRGGLTRDQELAFLKKKQAADREEATHVGDISMRENSPAIEGVGTGTKKPHRSLFQERQTEVAKAEHEGKPPPKAGRRRRSHKRKHTRRRR